MKKQTLRVLLNSYSEFLRVMPEDKTAYEICEQFAEMILQYQAELSQKFEEAQDIAEF